MKKKLSVMFLLLLILSTLVLAQINTEGIEDSAETIKESTEKLRELTEKENSEYLAQQWKSLFLNIDAIEKFDDAMKKLNIIFVVLLSRDYSFSLAMLFSFLLWIFTLLSLEKYFVFFDKGVYRSLAAFAGTILLAHMQIFNVLSSLAVKIVFLRPGGLWSFLFFFLIIIFIIVYFYINRTLAAIIKKNKEKAKKHELEHKVDVQEQFRKSVSRGI